MKKKTDHAGHHILLDLWNAHHLSNEEVLRSVLVRSAEEAKALVLKSSFHAFSQNGGITGVVLLKESHISIHTWPEFSYAAIDIFMCGKANHKAALDLIIFELKPEKHRIFEHERGLLGEYSVS